MFYIALGAVRSLTQYLIHALPRAGGATSVQDTKCNIAAGSGRPSTAATSPRTHPRTVGSARGLRIKIDGTRRDEPRPNEDAMSTAL